MPNLNPHGRLVVPYIAGDQGIGRPLPQPTVIWTSPNIRLVTKDQKAAFLKPEYWDDPTVPPWDGKVFLGTAYYLLVRVLNRGDFSTEPHDVPMPLKGISMEGWVSNFAAGSIGPVSQIESPPDPDNNGDSAFSGYNDGVVPPNGQLVVASSGFWVPQEGNIQKYNNGHVCIGVNVYSEGGDPIGGGGGVIHVTAEGEGDTYPADGKQLLARPVTTRLDMLDNTHHAQRNIMITPKPLGAKLVRKVLVEVPATDRCPLEAEVALRPAAVAQGSPELVRAAAAAGLNHHHCPPDPLENVSIDDNGDPSHEVGVYLKPGEQRWLTITVDAAENEKPGDIYVFDIVTTEEGNHKVYGAARMYVAVTPAG
ncbi:hypothetical protein [Nocardia pseudobrasiliensis]|uniref:Uncharacterized protein n=1 Tax=Nocardia pseudobrasiliensis TaxID=45979 RepID=A0A370IBQ6_9NOCA|nr:hypothetical protein [Nocardia pseudobrasiliensis]RDI68159.1 hypothetical protein DFR76_102560 [Nocardia pseudobrasiliensis]